MKIRFEFEPFLNIGKIFFYLFNIMYSIKQLTKFKKLMEKYGHYERVGNVCVFRSKNKATCVHIESKYLYDIEI